MTDRAAKGGATALAEANSVLVASPPVDNRTLVLKHGDTFAVLDQFGDIQQIGMREQGIYHFGCRVLSQLVLQLGGRRLLLLGSSVQEDNAILNVNLTNPDFEKDSQLDLPKDTVHLLRNAALYNDEFSTRLELQHYGIDPTEFELSINFGADFVDLFEVRGVHREERGEVRPPKVIGEDQVDLTYEGLDRRERRTRIYFDPPPDELRGNRARYRLQLDPHGRATIAMVATFDSEENHAAPNRAAHYRHSMADSEGYPLKEANLVASNEHFNAWVRRSRSDLHFLMTETPHGPYPYAGIPWFSTPFGRDGILTAMMYLWVSHEPARGVLRYLAATQANQVDKKSDAEPGKILHEARHGEMAALDEIPFRRYYGTVDATPLFVVLAEAYYRRTADGQMLLELWPHVERALEWIDDHGDMDGDGFIEYQRQAPVGILNQGWKDSNDSVYHADGRLAEAPIALCEVQGYVYAARCAAARMALALGKSDVAEKLQLQADELQLGFEQSFWSDELGTYAMALDADKQPCLVRSSNAGQVLWSGIASCQHAQRVAESLLSERFFSGWGIRTIAEGEPRFNPMSYHNGSIWPHDNAVIAEGFARYNLKDESLRVLQRMFDMSMQIDGSRLPELLCGFPRRPGAGPTRYPAACSPQAWSAASAFLLLKAALGLEVDATQQLVSFNNPRMPQGVRRLTIERLQVGEATIDLEIERHRHDVGIHVLRRTGQVRVEITN